MCLKLFANEKKVKKIFFHFIAITKESFTKQCLPYDLKCPSVILNPLNQFHDSIHGSLLGNRSLWVSMFSVCLSSRGTDSLFKDLSLQGWLYSKELGKTEMESPSTEKDTFVSCTLLFVSSTKIMAGTLTTNYKRFRVPKFKLPLLLGKPLCMRAGVLTL